jgi:aminopeptidase N
VMDRWFSIQASSRLPNSLQEVRVLLDNKKFSMKNPNKVRSLLGAFARNNFVNFHAIDGSGYQFISGKIIELDGLNPQIAARLAGVFTTWRRFDDQRQQLMKLELEKIVKIPSISADLYEIVHKSLIN